MTPQEQQQLSQFLNQLTQAKLSQKDPEAEALIQAAIKQQPDANYLLIQRALILEQALNNAKTQIADLQNQLRNTASNNTSFQWSEIIPHSPCYIPRNSPTDPG